MEPRDIENPIAEADFRHQQNTLYAFLYNPMIHESGYITISIHRTQKGAEKAMEFYKHEVKEEWKYRGASEEYPWDHCQNFKIETIQIQK
jgi:hypothetical protein